VKYAMRQARRVQEGERIMIGGVWRTVELAERNPDVPGNVLLSYQGGTYECGEKTVLETQLTT
jgi:hypothetical protein